jgi:hypothetical protein
MAAAVTPTIANHAISSITIVTYARKADTSVNTLGIAAAVV